MAKRKPRTTKEKLPPDTEIPPLASEEVKAIRRFDPLELALRSATEAELITKLNTVEDLLNDEQALTSVAVAASQGASVSTIGMMLGLEDGMLEQWLKNGEEDRHGIFRALFIFFRKAKSGAVLAAETALLVKRPDVWLDRFNLNNELAEATGSVSSSPSPEDSGTSKNSSNTLDVSSIIEKGKAMEKEEEELQRKLKEEKEE